ncbi:hypothetical protein C8N25_13614 [Algoriphagus antarcticus]|uniref:Uncharacterized protein n=1 Tax=Algoriphagus antarcticus TaxID=238540 RepID=A0A3E0D8Q8_9BACT|nr:hypothetical protein C8N25_13614 [Algoriphagus antarcticus]
MYAFLPVSEFSLVNGLEDPPRRGRPMTEYLGKPEFNMSSDFRSYKSSTGKILNNHNN